MDAANTITDVERFALRSWACSAPRSGMHIDEVLPALKRGKWLQATLLALEELLASPADKPMLVVACFPLECSTTLDTRPAEWKDVARMIGDEPPSLHLIEPDTALLSEDCEEYRYPLDVPLLGDRGVYYRCYRPRLGIENEWEYERAVYVEAVVPVR